MKRPGLYVAVRPAIKRNAKVQCHVNGSFFTRLVDCSNSPSDFHFFLWRTNSSHSLSCWPVAANEQTSSVAVSIHKNSLKELVGDDLWCCAIDADGTVEEEVHRAADDGAQRHEEARHDDQQVPDPVGTRGARWCG